jgi:SCP-2 sterol transfer family
VRVPLFPSQEWMQAFGEAVEADPRSGAMAEALEGVYRFVIEPGGRLDQTFSADVAITPDNGHARVTQVQAAGQPRLTITAAYPRWIQMLRGELDIPIAVMLRRVKVSGDLRSLTSKADAARPLLDALSAVDSQFLE